MLVEELFLKDIERVQSKHKKWPSERQLQGFV